MLDHLEMKYVGPAPEMRFDFAERMNILTGDNGLGKTFVLDVAWWALTRTWSGLMAMPNSKRSADTPSIEYQVVGAFKKAKNMTGTYNFAAQTWNIPQGRPTKTGMVIYAKVDGGFSVWDPARNYWKNAETMGVVEPNRPEAYHFSAAELWDGLQTRDGKILCNGLIRDWVSWQYQKNEAFDSLKAVLAKLSPHEKEHLKPGKPVRLFVNESRDFPTMDLPYGTVPLIHASAGMKRILSLAYILVWAWHEHVVASGIIRQKPTDRLVLLLDETESHLHPQWQRVILPAIFAAIEELRSKVSVQLIATTHAPLVMASLEPHFDAEKDKTFLFSIEKESVKIKDMAWSKEGDALSWLVSPYFGMEQARSVEAEKAIEAAEAFMRGETKALPPGLKTQKTIHNELQRLLPDMDPFWPRWVVNNVVEKR